MCVCYDTCSSYARANRVAALLLAQLWCARALACCCATCFLFLYVHTDLLLRFLLVFCMAGRPAFYATCSSCARAHWFAAAPLVFPQRTLRECTDHSSLKFSCGAQPSGRIVEEPAGNASFGPIFKSSRLVVWWIFEHQDSRFNLDMREPQNNNFASATGQPWSSRMSLKPRGRPSAGSGAMHVLGAYTWCWRICVVGVCKRNLFRQAVPTCAKRKGCTDPAKTHSRTYIMSCAWCSWSRSCYGGELA